MTVIENTTTRRDVDVELRPIEPGDADAVARILFEAFAGIHDHHRFARDFPTIESASGLVGSFIAHPMIWGVVALHDGRVVGSNFLDERGPVRGVGPITVSPDAQGLGVGRRLMQAVIDRGAGARGIRLLQDSFNTASLSLYASLGFDVAEPVALLGGRADVSLPDGYEVHPMGEADVAAAEDLHLRVHGFERTAELLDALEEPHMHPMVALRGGRMVAYAATLTFFAAAHAAAETEADLQALIAGSQIATDEPASFLLPIRQSQTLRWALGAGLRVVKPMTYMVIGEHDRPRGAWIPSVLY